MRHIHIEEVGIEEDANRTTAIASTVAQQSTVSKDIIEKEQQMFEKFTAQSPADIGAFNSAHKVDLPSNISETAESNCDTSGVKMEKLNISDKDRSVDNNVQKTKQNEVSDKSRKEKMIPLQNSNCLSPSTSPRELSVPNSSIQFQADYKLLKDSNEKFYQYFKVSINLRERETLQSMIITKVILDLNLDQTACSS